MPTPSGIISEPKDILRAMLAECASWRSFLGASSEAAAKAKTYTDFLFGDETLQLARPFGIVMFPRITLETISTNGGQLALWPRSRELVVQMFCDDPGRPTIVANKIPIIEIETGTMILENFIGNLFSELKELSALDDRLAINRLDWSQNWVRTKPETWPSEAANCYSFFTVGVEW
jgi:hypothetical protein